MINLINERCELSQGFTAYPTANLTISILGTQGSGKSTLLNALFASDFPVLEASRHRTRCTTGVWLNHIANFNVIDTQGFDSMERSQDQKIFEKQMSLFCVVISDIVLINLYMDEIGRHTGGHMDILEAIFKVGERLVTPHQKKIVYVIRDCTEDADHSILSKELSEQIKNLSKQHQNKQLKYTVEFHFMSHYIYQPQQFNKQAKQLVPRLVIRRPSAINNYKQEDRVKYLHEIWKQIKDSKTELDLKSIDDALKNYVMERITKEIIDVLNETLGELNSLEKVKSYERYVQYLNLKIHNYLSQNRPKHIKQKQLESHVKKIYDQFEPTATKHFNLTILKNVQDELEATVEKQIKKNNKNKKLSHLIFKKKKQVTDIYKKVIDKHQQYSLLIKNFHERMGNIIQRQENKLNHLFSLFQSTVERQLNKMLDKQAAQLSFNKNQISNKIKTLSQEYQYNQWEVDFAQIWEKVSYRCVEKIIPEIIQEKSLHSTRSMGAFSGDQTTSIIAIHTTLQKKALDFCREILFFLHEENTLTQPLSEIKDMVRECLQKRLVHEQRRWKLSLFMFSFVLLLLYGELDTMLGYTSIKKKRRRLYLRMYYWAALGTFVYCLIKEVYAFKKVRNQTV